MWNMVKSELKMSDFAQNSDVLFEILCDIWDGMTDDYVQSLKRSMYKKVCVLYDANGS